MYISSALCVVTDISEWMQKGATSLPSGVCWWLKKGQVPVDVFGTG